MLRLAVPLLVTEPVLVTEPGVRPLRAISIHIRS